MLSSGDVLSTTRPVTCCLACLGCWLAQRLFLQLLAALLHVCTYHTRQPPECMRNVADCGVAFFPFLLQKHKIAKQNQSGARTKKSSRKQAHKERLAEKVAAAHGDTDEQMTQVSKSSLKRKNPKSKKKLKIAQRSSAAGLQTVGQTVGQMED